MSVTGFWIVAAVPSPAVSQLRAGIPGEPQEPEDLSWWQVRDTTALAEPESRGCGPRCPTDAVLRFCEMIDARRPDFDVGACMDLLTHIPAQDRFVASIRKGDPVAALYYGLGFEAAVAMPGRSGCFLLTAEEVPDTARATDTILAMDPVRRASVATRINAWLQVTGDAPNDFDVEGLIDGPGQILGRANQSAQGALGIVQWY
jgi:hypothetical protein